MAKYLHGVIARTVAESPTTDEMVSQARHLRRAAEKVYFEDLNLWLELHRDADRWIQTAAICRRLDETKGGA